MTKKRAREALAREIAKRKGWFTANAPVLNDGRVTFGWFVRNRYLPLKKRRLERGNSEKQDRLDPL